MYAPNFLYGVKAICTLGDEVRSKTKDVCLVILITQVRCSIKSCVVKSICAWQGGKEEHMRPKAFLAKKRKCTETCKQLALLSVEQLIFTDDQNTAAPSSRITMTSKSNKFPLKVTPQEIPIALWRGIRIFPQAQKKVQGALRHCDIIIFSTAFLSTLWCLVLPTSLIHAQYTTVTTHLLIKPTCNVNHIMHRPIDHCGRQGWPDGLFLSQWYTSSEGIMAGMYEQSNPGLPHGTTNHTIHRK